MEMVFNPGSSNRSASFTHTAKDQPMKFIRSLGYAIQGLRHCLKHENNFRIQTVAALIAGSMGLYFSITAGEWIAIIFCCALVLTLEMVNTTVEELSDAITQDYSPVIKK